MENKNVLIFDKNPELPQRIMEILSVDNAYRTEVCTNLYQFGTLIKGGGNFYYAIITTDETLLSAGDINSFINNIKSKNPFTRIIVIILNENNVPVIQDLKNSKKIFDLIYSTNLASVVTSLNATGNYVLGGNQVNNNNVKINGINNLGIRDFERSENNMSANPQTPLSQMQQQNGYGQPNGYPQQPMGYPPPQNMGYGMPPQQNMGYPPQGMNMPPQQNMGMPPRQNMGVPPQQNMGYPPQGNYPPPQEVNVPPQQPMGYPPPQNMGYPPPQQNFNNQGYPEQNIPNNQVPYSQPQEQGYMQQPYGNPENFTFGSPAKNVTIAIHSPKGGVGKSTIAKELAGYYATLGLKTCLVDLDIEYGDIATMINLQPIKNIVTWSKNIRTQINKNQNVNPDDIVFSWDEIENHYLLKHASGFYCLPAPTNHRDLGFISEVETKVVLLNLARNFDVVIADTGPNIKDETILALELADTFLLVSNSDIATLSDIDQLSKTLTTINYPREKIKVILNETSKEQEAGGRETMGLLGFPNVVGVIPKGQNVSKANDAGSLMITGANSSFTVALKKIGDLILPPNMIANPNRNVQNDKGGLFGSLSKMFKK